MEHNYWKDITTMDMPMLGQVMDQYGKEIRDYAYFLTKDRELAKDITQDVFIKAYYHIQTYRGQSTLKSWLLAITRNTAFRYKRAAFFRKVQLLSFVPSSKNDRSAESEYLDEWFTDKIWDVIMALPDKYREVLVLDIRYELSTQEMAQLLNIAQGTVKSRLHRARERVQQNLKEVQA